MKIRLDRVDISMKGLRSADLSQLRVRDENSRVEFMVMRGRTCNLQIQSAFPDLEVYAFNHSVTWGGITRSVRAAFEYDCKEHVLSCTDNKEDALAHWLITPHQFGCSCKR